MLQIAQIRLRTILFVALLTTGLSCGTTTKSRIQVLQVQIPIAALTSDTYSYYIQAQVAIQERRWNLAKQKLLLAKKSAPNEPPIALALIELLYQIGEQDNALALTQDAKRRWPQIPEVWNASGYLHNALGRNQEALRDFKTAIQKGMEAEETILAYAKQQQVLGKLSSAQKTLENHYKTKNSSAEIAYQIALLLERKQKFASALVYVQKATKQSPSEMQYWALLSHCYAKLEQPSKAAKALQTPFDRSNASEFALENLFKALLELGSPQAPLFVKILYRDDLRKVTQISMGHVLLLLGQFQAALDLSQKIGAIDIQTIELQTKALRGLHRSQEAVDLLLPWKPEQKGFIRSRTLLTELWPGESYYEIIEGALKKSLQIEPNNAATIVSLSALWQAMGKMKEARMLLQSAIQEHPQSYRPQFALAELEARDGQIARSVDLILPIAIKAPMNINALNYVGYQQIQLPGEQEKAKRLIQRALHLAPSNPNILDSLGWVLTKQGQLSRAAALLQRALRLAPNQPEIMLHLAELRFRQGKKKISLELLKRALVYAWDPYWRKKLEQRRANLFPKFNSQAV